MTACPTCRGPLQVLGVSGRFAHYRCRDCGDTFTREDAHDPEEENAMHSSITPERVLELAEASIMDLDSLGICKACGEEQDGVEPDASGYRCEGCGAHEVTGIEALALEVL